MSGARYGGARYGGFRWSDRGRRISTEDSPLRIDTALRRLHSSELHNTTVGVFEPNESYEVGEGFSGGHADSPNATYEARVDGPTAMAEEDRAGLSADIDATVIVRDDTGQQWTGYGESGEAPARLKDTADGTVYQVEAVVDNHNGTLTLPVTEV